MHYTTVFDIAHRPFDHWDFFLSGLTLIVFGTAMTLAALLAPKVLIPSRYQRNIVLMVGVPFTLLSVLWTLQSGLGITQQNKEAVASEVNGGCSTVEGWVEDFKPMPFEGHQNESFTVSGVHFAYSDYVVTPGFNNTSTHGGPIREGLPVRICHSGNRILKLEIGAQGS